MCLRARGASTRTTVVATSATDAGSTLTSQPVALARRRSPQGAPSTAGCEEARCSASLGLQTGQDAWSPLAEHVHTCVAAPPNACTIPGSPLPTASIVTRIATRIWRWETRTRIDRASAHLRRARPSGKPFAAPYHYESSRIHRQRMHDVEDGTSWRSQREIRSRPACRIGGSSQKEGKRRPLV